MSKNIVFEGWLTKSPPNKRIWKTKWRRRWFALRQSGELPGQYFLDYFADRNCRRLKGTINLDLCEQVDAGLHMERGNGSLAQIRGSVFTIRTQTRIYHLEADCEADMEKWVDAICRVCGLRATDDSSNILGPYQNNMSNLSAMAEHQYDSPEGTGIYIPISECVTGSKSLDKNAFTFDRADVDISKTVPLNRVGDSRSNQMYLSQPQIRLQNSDLSENESNMSDEDCTSLNASDTNIREYGVTKSFTKLTVHAKDDKDDSDYEEGPPVPPRPLKTLNMGKEYPSTYNGPRIQEPYEMQDIACTFSWVKRAGPPSPLRSLNTRTADEDFDHSGHLSLQYHNLAASSQPLSQPAPPAVDRALKPRNPSQQIAMHPGTMNQNMPICLPNQQHQHHGYYGHQSRHGHIGDYGHHGQHGQHGQHLQPGHHGQHLQPGHHGQANHLLFQEERRDVLQYLDLDLPASKPLSKGEDSECVYKTVDFIKTEAFKITRQDAEASRNNPH